MRGLLGSLQTVLWEGSGWAPLGMGDLLEPNQVGVWGDRGEGVGSPGLDASGPALLAGRARGRALRACGALSGHTATAPAGGRLSPTVASPPPNCRTANRHTTDRPTANHPLPQPPNQPTPNRLRPPNRRPAAQPPPQVRKAWMKANLLVHPDKVRQRAGSDEQVAVADMIFDALKEAWGQFKG